MDDEGKSKGAQPVGSGKGAGGLADKKGAVGSLTEAQQE